MVKRPCCRKSLTDAYDLHALRARPARAVSVPARRLPLGPYLVLGAGTSGVAAADLLRSRNEQVWVASDDVAPQRSSSWPIHVGTEALDLLPRIGVVVVSPGVGRRSALRAAAVARRKPIISEVELAWRVSNNPVLAVTGTNGKTTVTSWIADALRRADMAHAVGGNIGTPLSRIVQEVDPGVTIVCEVSSFQLRDAIRFRPDVAVLLNLGEDHVGEHGSIEDYQAAKLRLFRQQEAGDVAVAPPALVGRLPGMGRRVSFGRDGDLDMRDGCLWWQGAELMALTELALRGEHNQLNAGAVAAACLSYGVPTAAVTGALRGFAGVPHRLQVVAELDGVLYINDSKATNVAATVAALRAMSRPTHLIAGGRSETRDFEVLRAEARKCASVHLIGEAAPAIGAAIGVGERHPGLAEAVVQARRVAKAGDAILLSPACKSFDQFSSFVQRGQCFERLVTRGCS